MHNLIHPPLNLRNLSRFISDLERQYYSKRQVMVLRVDHDSWACLGKELVNEPGYAGFRHTQFAQFSPVCPAVLKRILDDALQVIIRETRILVILTHEPDTLDYFVMPMEGLGSPFLMPYSFYKQYVR